MNYKEVVEQIRKASLVQYISKSIELEKRGNQYWGCCPFHHEKTPSFNISDEHNKYNCFGCNENGDIFNFVMKQRNVDFKEAVTILAKELNINKEYSKSDYEDFKDENRKKEIYKIALKNAHEQLSKEDLKNILPKMLLEDYQVGFISNKKYLYKALYDKNFSTLDIKKSNLFSLSDDKFLLLPIFNYKKEIINFLTVKYENGKLFKEFQILNKNLNSIYGIQQFTDYSNEYRKIAITSSFKDFYSLIKNDVHNVLLLDNISEKDINDLSKLSKKIYYIGSDKEAIFKKLSSKNLDIKSVELDNNIIEDIKDTKIKNDLYNLYNEVNLIFRRNYNYCDKSKEYVKNRGINEETITRFSIGYASEDPKYLYKELINKGFTKEVLEESGLFSKTYKELPVFKDRLMFAIKDDKGRIVAFSGRTLSKDEDAKYINSRNTLINNKSKVVYGLDENKAKLSKENIVTLVEGNIDVLSLSQVNIASIAFLGTGISTNQLDKLLEFEKVVLALDNDEAGKKAVENITNYFKSKGSEAKLNIVDLKDEKFKDPNDFLVHLGEEKTRDIFKTYTNRFDNNPYEISDIIVNNKVSKKPYISLKKRIKS